MYRLYSRVRLHPHTPLASPARGLERSATSARRLAPLRGARAATSPPPGTKVYGVHVVELRSSLASSTDRFLPANDELGKSTMGVDCSAWSPTHAASSRRLAVDSARVGALGAFFAFLACTQPRSLCTQATGETRYNCYTSETPQSDNHPHCSRLGSPRRSEPAG